MLWLYLLAVVTILGIALRRVMQRQTPLSDELYSTKVAFDHVKSGVAWVRGDGTYAWLNVLLVAVHDHKMRFVGHHCLVLDSTQRNCLKIG